MSNAIAKPSDEVPTLRASALPRTSSAPLDDDTHAKLAALVAAKGLHAASLQLGKPRNTVERALAKLTLRSGTRLEFRMALNVETPSK